MIKTCENSFRVSTIVTYKKLLMHGTERVVLVNLIQCSIINGDNIYNTCYVCANTCNPHTHAFHSILQLLLVYQRLLPKLLFKIYGGESLSRGDKS